MIFDFNQEKLNCFEMDGTIWFLANDIARILGYTDKDQAVRKHTFESDRKRLTFKASVDLTESNVRSLWKKNDYSDKTLVNESGVYCMIFGSKLPAAEEFKLWVTGTVLPAIRKHGGYVIGQENLSSDNRAELEAELERLTDQIAVLNNQNNKFKTRWHELITEKNELKDQVRNLKSKNKKLENNIKLLNKDADDTQQILNKALEDLDVALTRLNPNQKKEKERLTYKVDRNGFLVNE